MPMRSGQLVPGSTSTASRSDLAAEVPPCRRSGAVMSRLPRDVQPLGRQCGPMHRVSRYLGTRCRPPGAPGGALARPALRPHDRLAHKTRTGHRPGGRDHRKARIGGTAHWAGLRRVLVPGPWFDSPPQQGARPPARHLVRNVTVHPVPARVRYGRHRGCTGGGGPPPPHTQDGSRGPGPVKHHKTGIFPRHAAKSPNARQTERLAKERDEPFTDAHGRTRRHGYGGPWPGPASIRG